MKDRLNETLRVIVDLFTLHVSQTPQALVTNAAATHTSTHLDGWSPLVTLSVPVRDDTMQILVARPS